MRKKIQRVRTDRLSVSLPRDMTQWIMRVAEREEMGNVSAAIRKKLAPAMNGDRERRAGPARRRELEAGRGRG